MKNGTKQIVLIIGATSGIGWFLLLYAIGLDFLNL
jgi:NAD(P)-dependent dehydrogenase (short-subunit alcohol dehydrogenase family)